jgi:hypothetical protein
MNARKVSYTLGVEGAKRGRKIDTTYPTSERLERVHALLVLVLVFAQLLVDPYGGLKACLAGSARLIAIALEVPDLLVQLEVVGLERLDLAPQFGNSLKLTTKFLYGR